MLQCCGHSGLGQTCAASNRVHRRREGEDGGVWKGKREGGWRGVEGEEGGWRGVKREEGGRVEGMGGRREGMGDR